MFFPSVTVVVTHSVVEPAVSHRILPVIGSRLETRSQPIISSWSRSPMWSTTGDE
jgi:hypothetical protein